MPTCDECGRERHPNEADYYPFALIGGDPDPGWLSNDGEEMCGPCVVALTLWANRV